MKLLNNKLKMLLGLLGIAMNFSAQAQGVHQDPNSNLNPESSKNRDYQVVSQQELINALQNNQLEKLLMKKGVLIQKNSADSSLCLETSSGDNN